MLGFSLGKILVLAAIIAAVWYGFKWITRVRRIRDAKEKEAGRVTQAEDTVRCPTCGAFVVADGAGDCGRADCPYAG